MALVNICCICCRIAHYRCVYNFEKRFRIDWIDEWSQLFIHYMDRDDQKVCRKIVSVNQNKFEFTESISESTESILSQLNHFRTIESVWLAFLKYDMIAFSAFLLHILIFLTAKKTLGQAVNIAFMSAIDIQFFTFSPSIEFDWSFTSLPLRIFDIRVLRLRRICIWA